MLLFVPVIHSPLVSCCCCFLLYNASFLSPACPCRSRSKHRSFKGEENQQHMIKNKLRPQRCLSQFHSQVSHFLCLSTHSQPSFTGIPPRNPPSHAFIVGAQRPNKGRSLSGLLAVSTTCFPAKRITLIAIFTSPISSLSYRIIYFTVHGTLPSKSPLSVGNP